MPRQLMGIADEAHHIVESATQAGLSIDDDNVIDLLCDNIDLDVSIQDLRCALVVAGLAARFPTATR